MTWTVLIVTVSLALVYLLKQILFLLVFSVVFAYLIFPLVKLAERGLPGPRRRQLAIGVVYFMLITALSTIAALVGPRLGRELAALGERIPDMSARIQSGRVIGNIFPNWAGAEVLDNLVRSHLPQVVEYVQYGLTGALGWVSGAWIVVLIPVFAFFFLRDTDRITDTVSGLIDDHWHRQLWVTIALDLHSVLGGYVRALILLCLLTFVVWSALFLLARVPYALVLAAFGGALEFLPVIGPLVAGVVVIAVTLFSGFAHPWLLALFILLWRLVQDYGSSPLIMGRGLELHPGLVIFGVLAGGEVAGFAGMFLSVPVIAGLRIVWRRIREFRAALGLIPPTREHAGTWQEPAQPESSHAAPVASSEAEQG